MLKHFKIILISLALAAWGFNGLSFAQSQTGLQGSTVLPLAESKEDCDADIKFFNDQVANGTKMSGSIAPILGCAIKTGRISLGMVPYFIQYISNYILGLISIISLLFVTIGGFLYIAGGLTEQKDKGKTYIKNALIGMAIAFLAWSIVSVILAAITG